MKRKGEQYLLMIKLSMTVIAFFAVVLMCMAKRCNSIQTIGCGRVRGDEAIGQDMDE